MKNKIKQISMMTFGSVALVLCAITMPMNQAFADNDKDKDKDKDNGKVTICHVPSGNSSNPQTLSVDGSAVAAHISEHAGDYLGSCAVPVLTCVALSKLAESEDKYSKSEKSSKDEEDKSAKDEHDSKDQEDGYAKSEHDSSTKSESDGDKTGKSDHDSKAKDHEDKAKDHEDKAKDHEDKAKDHEDKAKAHDDRIEKIVAVSGNCKAVKIEDGVPSTEPGVWLSGDPATIAGALEQGTAGDMIDSSTTGSGISPDSSMESYREIRGE